MAPAAEETKLEREHFALDGIYPACNLASDPGLTKACSACDLSEQELEAQLDEHIPIPGLKALADAGVPPLHIHGD